MSGHGLRSAQRNSYPANPAELETHRERALHALGLHFASNDLDVDDLDRRMSAVVAAQSEAEVDAQLRGLPPLPTDAHWYEPTIARLVDVSEVPPRGVIAAVMGGAERKGQWLVPRHLKIVAVMGGVGLDLRQARFAPGVTEIEITVFMGGVEIIVPPDVTVESTGVAFMGGFETNTGDSADLHPGRPILRLSGFAGLGGVETTVKKVNKKRLSKFRKRLAKLRHEQD